MVSPNFAQLSLETAKRAIGRSAGTVATEPYTEGVQDWSTQSPVEPLCIGLNRAKFCEPSNYLGLDNS